MTQIELFDDLEVAGANGTGCAKPIGRRGGSRPRAPHRPRTRPPSTAVLLRSLRAEIVDALDTLARSLRRMEQLAGEQAARRAGDSENLHGLLRRVVDRARLLR